MLKINLANLPRIRIGKSSFQSVPQEAGVYIFFSLNLPIYIGKSTNLKSRLLSYLGNDLGPKTKKMVSQAEEVGYIKVVTELDALLLEAEMIRTLQPKYNVVLKDDKHPLYIKITKEDYPRVLTVRKDNLLDAIEIFGPFPSSKNVKEVLRLLRRIIPFSDHKLGKRKCIYAHIGLCNPCPNEINLIDNEKLKRLKKEKYRKNIRKLIKILKRNSNSVLNELKKQMYLEAKNENFEEAALLKTKIKSFEYILQPFTSTESFLKNPNFTEDIMLSEANELRKLISPYLLLQGRIRRIECFDVAHLAGNFPTASMVTFTDGVAEKQYYRQFKIRQVKGYDDVASMREVAERRIKNLSRWGRPDLIIVDGGRGQVSSFVREFQKMGIPVVGLAKRYESLVIPVSESKKHLSIKGLIKFKTIPLPNGPAFNLVTRLRDEAHRFARRYHHSLLRRSLLS